MVFLGAFSLLYQTDYYFGNLSLAVLFFGSASARHGLQLLWSNPLGGPAVRFLRLVIGAWIAIISSSRIVRGPLQAFNNGWQSIYYFDTGGQKLDGFWWATVTTMSSVNHSHVRFESLRTPIARMVLHFEALIVTCAPCPANHLLAFNPNVSWWGFIPSIKITIP